MAQQKQSQTFTPNPCWQLSPYQRPFPRKEPPPTEQRAIKAKALPLLLVQVLLYVHRSQLGLILVLLHRLQRRLVPILQHQSVLRQLRPRPALADPGWL